MSLDTTEASLDDRIRATVAESLGIHLSEVTHESDIVANLGADSLDCIELAMSIEQEFGISMSNDQMDEVDTVQELIDYVIVAIHERDLW